MANDLATGLKLGLDAARMAGAWDESELDRTSREKIAGDSNTLRKEIAGMEAEDRKLSREAMKARADQDDARMRDIAENRNNLTKALSVAKNKLTEKLSGMEMLYKRGRDVVSDKAAGVMAGIRERQLALDELKAKDSLSVAGKVDLQDQQWAPYQRKYEDKKADLTQKATLYGGAYFLNRSPENANRFQSVQQGISKLEEEYSQKKLIFDEERKHIKENTGTHKTTYKGSMKPKLDKDGDPIPGELYPHVEIITANLKTIEDWFDKHKGEGPRQADTEPELRESLGDRLLNMYNNRNMPTAPGLGLAPATGGVVLPGTGR